jgi:hypothetical protein
MINSNLFLFLAQTYVKLLDNDVIAKGYKLDSRRMITPESPCITYFIFVFLESLKINIS